MWTLDKIQEYLKENLKMSRYIHTLGVVEVAKELAKKNNVDESKAELAALIHDVAKNMEIDDQIQILERYNIKLDEITLKCPQVLHGLVGSIVAEKIIGIKDKEILDAIKYHATARKNMTKLEKIIYIADYIEPNRNYPGVEELRAITFDNLENGVLKGLDNTIVFVIKQNKVIHPSTIEARNHLLLNELKKIR